MFERINLEINLYKVPIMLYLRCLQWYEEVLKQLALWRLPFAPRYSKEVQISWHPLFSLQQPCTEVWVIIKMIERMIPITSVEMKRHGFYCYRYCYCYCELNHLAVLLPLNTGFDISLNERESANMAKNKINPKCLADNILLYSAFWIRAAKLVRITTLVKVFSLHSLEYQTGSVFMTLLTTSLLLERALWSVNYRYYCTSVSDSL